MAGRSDRQSLPISTEVSVLSAQLSDQGHKVTRPRQAVLAAIVALKGAFTVADVEQWLVARNASPGIASIFRTIKLLTDLNLLQRIHGVDDCHRYRLNRGHEHHLICVVCHDLVPFADCALDDLAAQLAQQTGYRIEGHLLEFFGRCPRCAALS